MQIAGSNRLDQAERFVSKHVILERAPCIWCARVLERDRPKRIGPTRENLQYPFSVHEVEGVGQFENTLGATASQIAGLVADI